MPVPLKYQVFDTRVLRWQTPHRSATAVFRPGTSDERALKEVINGHCYRKKAINFDVEQGERWLDLGANIGSFALYAYLRGAHSVRCFEPEPRCFQLLCRNLDPFPDFTMNNMAVTNSREPSLEFYKGSKNTDHYRGTVFRTRTPHPDGFVHNIYAGKVFTKCYDGVKMDIEGSELLLIDEGLIPNCDKLVMEYHFSRDDSIPNFRRRMEVLRQHFKTVNYIPSLDRDWPGDRFPGLYDRFVFCLR